MAKHRVTIKELAENLSLSTTTVSLALSGKGEVFRIAPETRERVRRAAEKLGYRPNHMAQSMRRGRSDTIGVLFPDVSEPYMNSILAGIETAALERGVSLMIATSTLSSIVEARNLESLMDRRIDGLILVPYAPFRGEVWDGSHIGRALDTGIPTVALDRFIPGLTGHAIIGADREAAREATGRLLAAGCRRPAYLGFDLEITTLEDRRRGFYDALEEHSGPARPEPLFKPVEILLSERNPRSSDLHDRLEKLAAVGEMPDAFLVSTDGLALKLRSLLREMTEFRTRRPENRRKRNERLTLGAPAEPNPFPLIARFGEDSPWFPTGMISILQPHREMGRRGAERLFDILDGRTIPENQRTEILEMQIPEIQNNGELQ